MVRPYCSEWVAGASDPVAISSLECTAPVPGRCYSSPAPSPYFLIRCRKVFRLMPSIRAAWT